MPRPVTVSVEVSPTVAELTYASAEMFTIAAETAVSLRGHARIAISGGTSPQAVFAMLADPAHPFLTRVPWARLQLFWVDERCVGPEDPESNFGMTKAVMLDKVPLPAENIHRMEGEMDPEEAASRYESEIRNTFKLEGAETPTFDLVVLGLGPDGHTASLFPHTAGLDEMARIVIANHVPQKDTWRISLTWPVITQGREVAFWIEGTPKAAIVKTVWGGAYDPEEYPAQLIRPASGKLRLMLDAEAAAELTPGMAKDTTKLELR